MTLPERSTALESKPETAARSGVTVRLRPTVGALGIVAAGSLAGAFLTSGVVSLLCFLFAALSSLSLLVMVIRSRPAEKVIPSAAEQLKTKIRQISKVRYSEKNPKLGEQAALLVEDAQGKFRLFEEILTQKFNRGELTWERYAGTGEQTFLAIVDQLHEIASRINSLETTVSPDEREKGVRAIQSGFAFIEKALTEFDRVITALIDTKTRRGESELDLETSMRELGELAARAKKYSIQ